MPHIVKYYLHVLKETRAATKIWQIRYETEFRAELIRQAFHYAMVCEDEGSPVELQLVAEESTGVFIIFGNLFLSSDQL